MNTFDVCNPLLLWASRTAVTLAYGKVTTVAIQERAVQHVVVGAEVDVRAIGHGPVFVAAQEEILPCLLEEVALDAFAAADALTEGGEKLLLAVPLDDYGSGG